MYSMIFFVFCLKCNCNFDEGVKNSKVLPEVVETLNFAHL